jgi:polyisoprenyl-teichoic acid--peptidoglycan teichoic acid transferase
MNELAPDSSQTIPRRVILRRTWVERLVLSAGVIATVISLLSASVLAWGLDKWNAIDAFDFGDNVGEAEVGEPANWLLVGSDSRDGIDASDPNAGVILGEGVPDGKRTDTILVARIDPAGEVIHLLSIPRDLFVTYSDGSDGRINAAFNGEDGAQRLLSTIEQNFNIDINHYAEINFAGFQSIVDELNGVPIWFDRPMRDSASGLDVASAGCQVLDGSQALAFARGRHLEYFENGSWHLDGTGDLGRNSRQQYFIRRLAATAIAKLDITNIGTINGLLDAGGSNLTRDQTTGPDDLVRLARTFANLTDDQIIGHSLPVFDFRTSSGAAVLGLEAGAAEPIFDIYRGLTPSIVADPGGSQPAPVGIDFAVLNGSRIAGQATEVAKALNLLGFNVPSVANAPTTERTVVRYPPGSEAAARRLISFLVAGPAYEADASLDVVQLVTGADFEGLRGTARDNVTEPAGDDEAPVAPAPVAVTQSTIGVVPGPTPAGTLCE